MQATSPYRHEAKFAKRYNYASREKYVCTARIKWKYIWEIRHLHWIAIQWLSLGKHNFQDQDGTCSLLSISSWPYFFKTWLTWGCRGPSEGTWPRTQRNLAPEAQTAQWGSTLSGSRAPFTPWWSSHTFSPKELCSCLGAAEGLGRNGEGGEGPSLHGLMTHISNYKSGAVRGSIWSLWGECSDFNWLSSSAVLALGQYWVN